MPRATRPGVKAKDDSLAAETYKLNILKRNEEVLSRRLSKLKQRRAKMEFYLYHRMIDEGFDPEKEDGIRYQGVLYKPRSTTFAQVTDRSQLVPWLRKHTKILVTEQPSKKDLNQLVRRILDDGGELPPGLSYNDRIRIETRGLTAKETEQEDVDDEGE